MKQRSYHLLGIHALSAALFLTATALRAEIIGVEQFDYPDGAIANQNGATFWDYQNFTPTGHTGAASNWDNVVSAPTVSASNLVTNSSSAKREYNANEGNGAVNDPAAGAPSVAHAVYYRVTVTTGATLPDFFGLSSYDFGTERVFFGKPFGQANFGLNGGGANVLSSVPIKQKTTYTLVTRIDFFNNTIRLYVDPDLSALETANTPAATDNNYTNTFFSTAVRLASGAGAGDAVTWDNLVVATTWDDLGTVVTTVADEDNVSLDPAAGSGAGVSLREAVKYSPSGTLITFAPALNGGTITLTNGQFTVPGAISLDASSLAKGVTLDANESPRHFQVGTGKSLAASGLTFTRGGGVFGSSIFNDGTLSLSRCSFTDNLASGSATVLQQSSTSVSRFDHCTFSGNRTTGAGSSSGVGGLQIIGGSCRLSSCTISGNTGTGAGGGLLLNNSATVQIERCIIAGNIDPGFPDIARFGGTLTAIGPSLIGNNFSVESTFPAGTLVGSPTTPLNPRLSPLGYFGGPTLTMHPLVNSLAIDAGSTTDPGGTDQRGFPGFVDGDGNGTPAVDLGAVEAGLRGPDAFNPFFPVTTAVDEDDGTIGQGSGQGTSLREAIKYLPNGAVIIFINALSGATIPLDLGPLDIPDGETLFIDGSNLFRPITISGKNASRVFNIPASTTVAMQRLILIEGKAPDGFGGGSDDGNGGAIHSQGTLSLLACTLSGNISGTGESFADSSQLFNSGGAVYSDGRTLVSGCTFSGNRCANFDKTGAFAGVGGAILNDATGLLTVVNSTVSRNAAGTGYIGGAAGAIFNRGIAAVSASTLSGNAAGSGTGLYFGGAGRGGAIFNDQGTLRVSSSTLNGNTAGFSVGNGGTGGAIYNKGTLTVANSTFTNNSCGFGGFGSGGSGGAIFGENTPLEVYHCTITGNFAAQGGSSNGVGGGIYQAGSFSLSNSIVTKNYLRLETTGETFEDNLAGSNPNGSGNLTSGDPKLAPLSDYGGPTFTMFPLPGSPAIDAASGSTAIDQRGLPRTGSRDIGAVEVQPALVGFVDTDSDGMDDRLEPLYGFVVGLADGQLDNDGDGSTNAEELGNLTGPRDHASLLKILTFSRPGNNVALSWTTFPGLSYTLEYGSTLSFGATVGLGTATGMTASNVIGPFNDSRTFIRIRRN